MSTLGKVLTILIVLALLGWTFLAALVAEHHIQWAKRFDVVQKEVEEAKKPLPGYRAEIYDHTNATIATEYVERLSDDLQDESATDQPRP